MKHSIMHRQAPSTKISPSPLQTIPSLRNLPSGKHKCLETSASSQCCFLKLKRPLPSSTFPGHQLLHQNGTTTDLRLKHSRTLFPFILEPQVCNEHISSIDWSGMITDVVNEKYHHSCKELNTWSQVGGTVWGDVEGVVIVEEIDLWVWAVRLQKHVPLLYSFCLMFMNQDVSS